MTYTNALSLLNKVVYTPLGKGVLVQVLGQQHCRVELAKTPGKMKTFTADEISELPIAKSL